MTDFDAYVPRHKCDIERAEAAVRLGYPEAEPILGRLIEWLQDYNWPVAHIIAPFLASIGRPVVPQIWLVLRSDDMQWKYWVISQVIRFLPNHVALEFRSEGGTLLAPQQVNCNVLRQARLATSARS